MLALIGALLVLCLTLWAKYELDTRFQMALTHAHFTEALQLSKKNMVLASNSENDTQPRNTGEWIALFNTRARHAPKGGPAYIVNSNGNAGTGAIGVSATNYGESVELSRPAFHKLTAHKVIVAPDSVQHDSGHS